MYGTSLMHSLDGGSPCTRATPCLQVSLHMMVVYFWLIALVIGSMFMWSIAALDFHSNFRVRIGIRSRSTYLSGGCTCIIMRVP